MKAKKFQKKACKWKEGSKFTKFLDTLAGAKNPLKYFSK